MIQHLRLDNPHSPCPLNLYEGLRHPTPPIARPGDFAHRAREVLPLNAPPMACHLLPLNNNLLFRNRLEIWDTE